jgi:hypothetical protein
MAMRLDISQKKLYEKLVILEKYCIKLEKRVAFLESNPGETRTSSRPSSKNPSKTKPRSESISTQTTNQPKKQTKKVKKLFDKYKMNPVNI